MTTSVFRVAEYSAPESEQDRLARTRPADRSPKAIRDALAAVDHERIIAARRLERAREHESDRLEHGQAGQVHEAREARKLVEIALEQLEVRQASLTTSLRRAEALAIEGSRTLEQQADQARTAAAKMVEMLPSYHAAAETVARFLAQEKAAQQAIEAVRRVVPDFPGAKVPSLPDLPKCGDIGDQLQSFGTRACLPGTPVRPAPKPVGDPYMRQVSAGHAR